MKSYGVASRHHLYIKLGVFLLLLFWFSFFMAQRIDLATADLGRHIKNGEWVIANHFNLSNPNSPIRENYYSYTNTDFPFVNHHWASGVAFFLIYKAAGFSGLSVASIILSAAIFSIFFYIAVRESNFTLASILSFFLIPLMAERREIRPEIFSVLLAAVFFLVLWLWQRKEISWRWLLVLPVLMIFWVNLHIYFFLGLFLIGVFLFSEIVEMIFFRLTDNEFAEVTQKIKRLSLTFALTLVGTLVNPFGLAGALHPLKIYGNYGYPVLEEKSVWFLENYGIKNPNFMNVKISLILMLVGFVLLAAVDWKRLPIRYLLLAVFFGTIGWLALRNFTLLGFFALPATACFFSGVFKQRPAEINMAKENGLAILYIAVVIVGVYGNFQFASAHSSLSGLGLRPGVQEAANFFREEKIAGPIFNDYDIGGYLIFNLAEKEKVFVDNRPEAYPESFFSGVYKPMQENPEIFEKVDQEYNFNAIFFYRNDITPWAQTFFEKIRENENWAKVYEDDYAIIYLKK